MKIKFIGETTMTSKGLQFTPGFSYDVSKEVYEYLKKTFSNVEALEDEKVEVNPKEEEAEVKPKVGTKVSPKK